MAFTGSEGKAIDPNKAALWTRNYREANPGGLQARFFGREILLALLNQPGCEGVRIYHGLNGTEPQLVAVGANNEENDQLGEGFLVADETMKGPPHSGQPNMLNS